MRSVIAADVLLAAFGTLISIKPVINESPLERSSVDEHHCSIGLNVQTRLIFLAYDSRQVLSEREHSKCDAAAETTSVLFDVRRNTTSSRGTKFPISVRRRLGNNKPPKVRVTIAFLLNPINTVQLQDVDQWPILFLALGHRANGVQLPLIILCTYVVVVTW
jgi:hypothetical protein